jgi:hypothetical protein
VNQPKFSWRLELLALAVGVLLGASTVLAFRQGRQDNQAKVALQAALLNDRRIEAARIERVRQINHVNQAQCASLANLYSIIRLTLRSPTRASTRSRITGRIRWSASGRMCRTPRRWRSSARRRVPRDITLPNKPIITKP